jgi:hypothetical protein
MSSDNKEIVLPVSENLIPILFTDKSHVDSVIEEIRVLASKVEPDLSTSKSRQAIASMAYRVTRSKTYLDSLGKNHVDDMRAKIDYVNSMRRHLSTSLDGIRDEVRKPLTDWEEAELARIAALSEQIAKIDGLEVSPNDSSDAIKEKIVALEELLRFNYQEREEEAFEKISRKKEQFSKFLDLILHTENLQRVNAELQNEVKRNREAQAAQNAVVKPEAKVEPERIPAQVHDPEPEPKSVEIFSLMMRLRSVEIHDSIELDYMEVTAIMKYVDELESQCQISAITPRIR